MFRFIRAARSASKPFVFLLGGVLVVAACAAPEEANRAPSPSPDKESAMNDSKPPGVKAEDANASPPGSPADAVADSSTNDNADAADIDFEASIRADRTALVVKYRVTNRSRSAVLLLNRVPREMGSTDLSGDANSVYVEAQPDGTIEISKRAYGVPAGISLEIPERLGFTKLARGASFNEVVNVPLPLERRRPYASLDAPAKPLPESVRRVRFCLGVVREGDVQARGGGAKQQAYVYHDNRTARAQRLLCSAVQNLD